MNFLLQRKSVVCQTRSGTLSLTHKVDDGFCCNGWPLLEINSMRYTRTFLCVSRILALYTTEEQAIFEKFKLNAKSILPL